MVGCGIIHINIVISIVSIVRFKISIFIDLARTAVVGHLGLNRKWLIGKWLLRKWLKVGGGGGARTTRWVGTRVYSIRWTCCITTCGKCCRETGEELNLLLDTNFVLTDSFLILGAAARVVRLDPSAIGRRRGTQGRRRIGIFAELGASGAGGGWGGTRVGSFAIRIGRWRRPLAEAARDDRID
jgi:hypothetical protein